LDSRRNRIWSDNASFLKHT